ncbi:MAG: GNAT family N-acetyltransferase [Alphaproteobacteria bacterium]
MFRRRTPFEIRPLRADDAPALATLFAEFQAAFGQPARPFTAEVIRRDGFGDRPHFQGLLVWPATAGGGGLHSEGAHSDDSGDDADNGGDARQAGGGPAGFLLWTAGYDTDLACHGAYVLDLYVAPPWRRRGMARAMLARLAANVRDAGGGFLFWGTDMRNRPAVNLYERIATPQTGVSLFACDGDAFLRLAGEGRRHGGGAP